MSKPIPLSGGRKILPSREDLERQPFSFFASGKKRTSAAASAKYDLSGLILDDEGDPISGVTVTLSGDADSSVVTGVDGAFLFEDLSKGDYTVTPSRASFVFTPASRSVTQLAEDTALDSFEGVGSIYIISGTITGDEVENVTVTLSGDDNDEVITGADGTYSFEGLADGDYTVTPSLDGYGFTPAATNVTINNADQTGQDFVSALLVYDISGAITGGEVEGVTVTLSGDANDSVVTGVGGTFTFADLPPGDYTLTPTLAGYTFAPASINVTIVAADQTDQDFVSTLITWSLSGTVTGAVVEGVTITLTGDASDSTTTAADGTYSFSGLVDGSYNVEPSLAGYTFTPTDTDVTINGADDTDSDFVSAVETLTLPYYFEFSDLAAADGTLLAAADSSLSHWTTYNHDFAIEATLGTINDPTGYRPNDVTKIALADNDRAGVVKGQSFGSQLMLPKKVPAGLPGLRFGFLVRSGDPAREGGYIWLYGGNPADNAPYIRLKVHDQSGHMYASGVYTEGGASQTEIQTYDGPTGNVGAGTIYTIDRWHWLVGEWNWTTNKVNVRHYADRYESGKYIEMTMSAAGQAIGGTFEIDRILFEHTDTANVSARDWYIAKFWIGSLTDAYPERVDWTISGLVVDGADDPIDGVSVQLLGPHDGSDTTDANGAYDFQDLFFDGDFRLTPSKSGLGFTPPHQDVTLAGANIVVPDFVGAAITEPALPASFDFDTARMPADTGWVVAGYPFLTIQGYPRAETLFGNDATTGAYMPEGIATNRIIHWLVDGYGGAGAFKWGMLKYGGWAGQGVAFNQSKGIRLMAAFSVADQWYAYPCVGLCKYSATVGTLGDDFIRATHKMRDNITTLEEVAGGVAVSTVNVASYNKAEWKIWYVVGLEIPANGLQAGSSLKMRVGQKYLTNSSYHYDPPLEVNHTLVTDFTGAGFDSVFFGGYSRNEGTYNDEYYLHWMWVGTASDDWPV